MVNAVLAPVNKIIPLSFVDGPGARTVIFLQRCNIGCIYCHNPETQRMCNHCGSCVEKCPANALSLRDGRVTWDEARCINCDSCIRSCDSYSTPKVRWMSAAEVMERIRPNLPFVRGITVSGGECTLHSAFLEELFTLAREQRLTCLVDSNGMIPFARLDFLMRLTDGVLLDLKAWDRTVFRALTGAATNAAVKENLAYLSRLNKLSELRIVYLPGFVDAHAAIGGAAGELGEKTKHTRLKLIAFRSIGVRGTCADMLSPSPVEMRELEKAAFEAGFREIVIV